MSGEEAWLHRAAMFGQWLTELVRQDLIMIMMMIMKMIMIMIMIR